MNDQLLQGGNVFEITDYTTASDWERFTAGIEEILTHWNLDDQHKSKGFSSRELPSGFISRGIWHERHDTVRYGSITFDLRYQYLDESKFHIPVTDDQLTVSQLASNQDNDHDGSSSPDYEDAKSFDGGAVSRSLESDSEDVHDGSPVKLALKQEEKEHGEYELPENLPDCLKDMINVSNDFASKAHCLVRWYNLRKFIILSAKTDHILSEDRVKLVLSSVSIALSNIKCHVPIFVHIHNPRDNFYQGISEHFNIRTLYEMVYFKRALSQYAFLSDLIRLFREKAGCNLNDPITVSARLNYCLDKFELFLDPKDNFEGNEHSDDERDELVKLTERKVPKTKKPNLPQDMRSGCTFEQVVEAMDSCVPHPFRILKFIHVAALWPPVSDKVITDTQVHSDLDPAEAPIWTIRCVTSDNCNLKIVHETQAIYELLCAAINYAYDKLDADVTFNDCDREELKTKCLRLSYELATKPEVILSEQPSDSVRKLVALMFYRASELTVDLDALGEIAQELKRRPSLSEIYRTFVRRQSPSVKEFIIRTQVSRPFNSTATPALPQRMFCTICNEEFRLCGAFSELCN